jgi:hypothetical protein
MGDCRKGSPNCFKCGKFGHYQRTCPLNLAGGSRPRTGESPQQARAYSLVFADADREEFANMEKDDI